MSFIKKYQLLFFTILSISFQIFFSNEIKEVSNLYSYSFTPAGWTFTIWGFIYFLLIFNNFSAIKEEEIGNKTSDLKFNILIINLLLPLWVFLWINKWFFLSSGILFITVINFNLHYYKKYNEIILAWFIGALILNILVAISSLWHIQFNKDFIYMILLLIFFLRKNGFFYALTTFYIILGIILN